MMPRIPGVLVGLTFLLVASANPAVAMDQSAVEETNCLMACDANQENCLATGYTPTSGHRPRKAGLPQETRLSRSLRRTANFSQIDQGKASKERLH
jgi:hypothetical protein